MIAARLSLDQVTGLRPTVWLSVGGGYAREEVKSLILNSGEALVAEAVTTPVEIARRILRIPADRILEAPARQEVLRLLLAEGRISERFEELKRLKRQRSFFRRLDQAIQAGRMAAAHLDEEAVQCERLVERLGARGVRDELRLLRNAYEAWLQALALWDPPLLLRLAIEELSTRGWPTGVARPQEIQHLSLQAPEGLERAFCDAVGRELSVQFVAPSEPAEIPATAWGWERWHTLDDACERLAEELAHALGRGESLADHAVLIADSASLRRSLKRALRDWGVPEADPRDPLRLQSEEAVKWALLPLEVVRTNFERLKLEAWIRGFLADEESRAGAGTWIAELAARGAREGAQACQGGVLAPLQAKVEELLTQFGGRKRCAEIAEAHLKLLRENVALRGESGAALLWVVSFFEGVWKKFLEDLERLELGHRKAPLLYWLERLQARISETPAPVERMKAREGLAVYRLQQAPLTGAAKVWVLGLPAHWLSAEGLGDYWFNARERDVLSAEFAVRSGIQIRAERLTALRAWAAGACELRVLDALYDADGRERELIAPVLKEWGAPEELHEPQELGAHPRWLASYGALRPLQPQRVTLDPLPLRDPQEGHHLTATTLDRYSRCPFQSLIFDRWRLRDARVPDCELWADARGNLLHEAVRILIQSRNEEGAFTCSTRQALEQAWKLKPPKGLIRSLSFAKHLQSRLVDVLDRFCAKEREYFERARAQVRNLEDLKFKVRLGEVTIVGTPDRIDETPDGLFVMDYKTSGSLPNGTEMTELGYRLQLPFYALAAERMLGKPVVGVQFVELSRKAGRSNGIFFKPYNGKEAGKLTYLRANSKSLLAGQPAQVWEKMEAQVRAHAEGFVAGSFPASAKKADKECNQCQVADTCGFRRKLQDAQVEELVGEAT